MRPALAGHPKVELVAAADPREEARARFAAEFGGTHLSVRRSDLCADPNVDAVYVATPHEFHAENVITAAQNGKHVLVEKPMALSIEECQAMIEAARKRGRSACCRSQPQFRCADRAHARNDRRRNIRRACA